MTPVLAVLCAAPPEPAPIAGLREWWQQHRAIAARYPLPVDGALAAGFAADRLGYAFASGYQAAGAQLFGASERLTAFCVTEEGGAHPRAITTALSQDGAGYRLDGSKFFVTLGPAAEDLLVVASTGLRGDKNQLRVLRIDAARAGVELAAAAPVPFVPEIPHALVRFHSVRVAQGELLAGDGYLDFVKPFRTSEDCHVHAALLGWLMQIARRAVADRDLLEAIACAAVAIRALALADAREPAIHLAPAGALATTRALIDRFEPLWPRLDAATRERWQRDRPLLNVASKARALRTEAAWRSLTPVALPASR